MANRGSLFARRRLFRWPVGYLVFSRNGRKMSPTVGRINQAIINTRRARDALFDAETRKGSPSRRSCYMHHTAATAAAARRQLAIESMFAPPLKPLRRQVDLECLTPKEKHKPCVGRYFHSLIHSLTHSFIHLLSARPLCWRSRHSLSGASIHTIRYDSFIEMLQPKRLE